MSDAGPSDTIWFAEEKKEQLREYLQEGEGKPYRPVIEETKRLIDGFESPLGMELLATVDWLLSMGSIKPTLESVRAGLRGWPGGRSAGERKIRLFDDRLMRLALARLAPDSGARLPLGVLLSKWESGVSLEVHDGTPDDH